MFGTLTLVRGSTFSAGMMIVVVAGMLGGADYWWKERFDESTTPETVMIPDTPVMPVASGSALNESGGMIASSGKGVKKGVSLKKQSGPMVEDILATLQLVTLQTTESSLLSFMLPQGTAVHTTILLQNNDRAALLSWTETDTVKVLFSGLKKALQEQFSPKVTGLIDETRTQEDGPPVDFLSFLDPGISTEKIMFLRVRTRLYELHVATGKDEIINRLVEELSK